MAVHRADVARFVDPGGKSRDPKAVIAIAAFWGATLASPGEMEAARALAARTVSSTVVSAEQFALAQRTTGASIFVVKEQSELTGAVAFFALSRHGLAALELGTFNSADVPATFMARPGEEPFGVYAWGFTGITRAARNAVVATAVTLQEALWWALPAYTRVATPEGAAVLIGKMGYAHVPGDTTGLARKEPSQGPLMGIREAVPA
jgi:hypothetical protein